MKEDRTIFDDQICQALAGHTSAPSPALRDALMARVAASHPAEQQKWLNHKKLWLSAAAFLLISVSLYFLLSFNQSSGPEPTVPESKALVQAEENSPLENNTTSGDLTQEEPNHDISENTDTQPLDRNQSISRDKTVESGSVTATGKEKKTADNLASNQTEVLSVAGNENLPTNGFSPDAKTTYRSGYKIGKMQAKEQNINNLSHSTTNEIKTRNVSSPVKVRFRPDETPAPAHFSKHSGPITLGAHYTPEIMFNVLDNDNKFVHNTGIELLYNYHDFSIRTGVSLGFATGSSSMAVDYKPYKGSFQHLDSLEFVYDMQSEQLVAVYHTSERKVYDSVAKQLTTKIDKQYTYLQIPLIFGYNFYEAGRFAMSVHAGPTLSMLLSTKEDSNYDPGNNLIINTSTVSPDRIKTNWQFSAGIGFGYSFTPRLRLEMEPRVKYYFNSVYEKAATTRKPWSFELRTGLLYTF
ncbi:MAG: outer membrane beta-barrel protein [Bacteroidales bacterium]|nr:outer membrane beta-barrel protein [Bacteroidales bacterium]MDD3664577.1 outer membrane beta-barrel protein [Bacteroidales bacterium]